MNAKIVSKSLVIAIIFVLAMSIASSSFAKGRGDSPESSEDWFDVHLVSAETATDGGSSTWTYQVVETGKGKDLSHWALALECPNGDRHTVVDANPKPYEVGINPHTGLYSIKWDVNDDFESGYFSVTLDGAWEEGMVQFATKAGRSVHHGQIDGPTCENSGGGDPGGGGV